MALLGRLGKADFHGQQSHVAMDFSDGGMPLSRPLGKLQLGYGTPQALAKKLLSPTGPRGLQPFTLEEEVPGKVDGST